MTIDLVYPLGSGSHWNDNELRYSLRSVEQYFAEHVGNVHILSERLPGWLEPSTVVHWPVGDPFVKGGDKKIRNTTRKFATFCGSVNSPRRFMLMHDDFYFVDYCRPVEFEPETSVRGHLNVSITNRRITGREDNYYLRAMEDTLEFLRGWGYATPYDFSLHRPMIFDTYVLACALYEVGKQPKALLWRTVYGNWWFGAYRSLLSRTTDVRIDDENMLLNLNSQVRTMRTIATGPNIVRRSKVRRWFQQMFPGQSKYEKPEAPGYQPPIGSALSRMLRLNIK